MDGTLPSKYLLGQNSTVYATQCANNVATVTPTSFAALQPSTFADQPTLQAAYLAALQKELNYNPPSTVVPAQFTMAMPSIPPTAISMSSAVPSNALHTNSTSFESAVNDLAFMQAASFVHAQAAALLQRQQQQQHQRQQEILNSNTVTGVRNVASLTSAFSPIFQSDVPTTTIAQSTCGQLPLLDSLLTPFHAAAILAQSQGIPKDIISSFNQLTAANTSLLDHTTMRPHLSSGNLRIPRIGTDVETSNPQIMPTICSSSISNSTLSSNKSCSGGQTSNAVTSSMTTWTKQSSPNCDYGRVDRQKTTPPSPASRSKRLRTPDTSDSDMVVLRALCDEKAEPDTEPLLKLSRKCKSQTMRSVHDRTHSMEIGHSTSPSSSDDKTAQMHCLRTTNYEEITNQFHRSMANKGVDKSTEEISDDLRGSPLSKNHKRPLNNGPRMDNNDEDNERHHPEKLSPPAMDARVLECITALALYSGFPISTITNEDRPAKDEFEKEANSIVSDNISSHITAENDIEHKISSECERCGEITKNEITNPEEMFTDAKEHIESNDRKNEKSISDENILPTGSDKEEEQWPNSAVDDDLRKKLENYKGTDVPMIYAFLLPSKGYKDDPIETDSPTETTAISPSGKSEIASPLQSVPSIALPAPIVDILLDRILKTLLN